MTWKLIFEVSLTVKCKLNQELVLEWIDWSDICLYIKSHNVTIFVSICNLLN